MSAPALRPHEKAMLALARDEGLSNGGNVGRYRPGKLGNGPNC